MSDDALTNPRRWWEPVDEAQAPELTERILYGGRWYMGVALLLRAAFWGAWAAAQELEGRPHLLAPGVALLLSAGLTARLLRAGRAPEVAPLLWAQEALYWLGWTVYGISEGGLLPWYHAQVLAVPLLTAMVPIRPALLLALGASQGWWLFLELGYSDGHPALRALLGLLGLWIGVMSATFSQIQRHLFRQMGQQQQRYIARERLMTLGAHTTQRLARLEGPLREAHARLRGARASPSDSPDALARLRAQVQESARDLEACAQRLQQLHQQTQRLGQHDAARLELPQALQAALSGRQRALREAQITWQVSAPPAPLSLEGDPQKLEQLLEALLSVLEGCAQGPSALSVHVERRGEALRLSWALSPARAPSPPPPELVLARDLARGFFDGDLVVEASASSLRALLTLAPQDGAQEAPTAYAPCFCPLAAAKVSHAAS
jgi:hypothetical protein